MSRKTKTTATDEEAKLALVPKLRFPEFRGAEEWQNKRLGELFADRQESGLPGLPLLSLMDKEGIIPQEDSNRKNNSNSDKSKYLRVVPGDIAYNTMRMWEGRSALVGIEGLVSPAYTVCKPQPGVHSLLFSYYFKTPQIIEQFQRFSQGLVKDTLNLKYPAFAQISVPVPTYPEQQKIAECLRSLDELIAVQARKVDALKAHKKGLMQQLFPREGETQPRLRFPEFQNAGKWRREALGSLCARIMDGTHFSPKSKEGPRPYLTSKNIKNGKIDLSNISYISEEEHVEIYNKCPVKPRDVLLTKDGANTGNCAINNLDFEFSLLSSVAVLRGKKDKLCQEFLFQSILSESIQSLIIESMSGQAITRITLAKISGFTISVTSSAEQYRIADCLSSLDALITAETQKHEALKTHKRGLMQKLFPSPEEVEI